MRISSRVREMLSKIKSPSLVEGRSPLAVHHHQMRKSSSESSNSEQMLQEDGHESDREQAQPKMGRDEDLDSQHEAADLVIDQPRSPTESQADETTQDDNNNINNNNNNNNNNSEDQINNNNNNNNRSDLEHESQEGRQTQGKRTQNELLDIIELSRKRRLSKDSADSLTSFIHWSFSHFEAGQLGRRVSPIRRNHIKRESGERELQQDQDQLQVTDEVNENNNNNNNNNHDNNNRDADKKHERQPIEIKPDEAIKYATERVLRNRAAKLSSSSSGHQQAANMTVARALERQHLKQQAFAQSSPIKRSRLAIANSYSPEPPTKQFNNSSDLTTNGRKFSHTQLGNVVERLHQQRQDNNQLRAGRFDELAEELHIDEPLEQPLAGHNGLSLQLQQFLHQQQQHQQHQQQQQQQLQQQQNNKFNDLNLGLEDAGNQQQHQLALAAAIHRALINGGNGNGAAPDASKSINGTSHNLISSTTSASSANNSFASSLVDSLGRQHHQRQQPTSTTNPTAPRAYNTRHAGLAHAAANLASSRLQQHQHLPTINGSGQRAVVMQQQQARHAQAAAALSALANGAHPGAALHHFAAAAAAAAAVGQPQSVAQSVGPAAAAAALLQQQRQQQHQQQLGGLPIGSALSNQTDFKCDTCPSSFDDRHRLMQHQSIHLELKKDWFTETPVEEVMRIFNRRRGEFLCNMCNLRFEATLDYDQHNHTVHGPRPYCCQFCGNGTRTFKCWRQYLNHLYDHRYIFSCTIGDCDFTVNRRDSLRFHIFRFHLNCQLPQNLGSNGQNIQTSPFNLSQSAAGNAQGFHLNSASQQDWPNHMDDERPLDEDDDDDDEDDTENEMNVAD